MSACPMNDEGGKHGSDRSRNSRKAEGRRRRKDKAKRPEKAQDREDKRRDGRGRSGRKDEDELEAAVKAEHVKGTV